jgi:hypothetical protein
VGGKDADWQNKLINRGTEPTAPVIQAGVGISTLNKFVLANPLVFTSDINRSNDDIIVTYIFFVVSRQTLAFVGSFPESDLNLSTGNIEAVIQSV